MKSKIIALSLLGIAVPSFADNNINQIDQLLQADFRNLSEDMGAALSYKAVIPAKPLGITGFDIGMEVTATKLKHPDVWDRASSGNTSATVYIPKLHVHKGLPAGFDIGAFYTSVPNSNIKLWGGELRYAILEGSVVSPALGVRGSYSKLTGVDQLNFHTTGLELVVSKGFAIITPYAGVGQVWTTSEPAGDASLVLHTEKFGLHKYFVGGNMNFGLGNLALEADKTGDATSYNLKVGFRF